MSGDKQESREAQLSPEDKRVLDSFLRKGKDDFLAYMDDAENIKMVNTAGPEVQDKFLDKCRKHGFKSPIGPSQPFTPGSMAGQGEAPNIIKERAKSDPPPPPESGDIEYFTRFEESVGNRINTLDTRLIADPDATETHTGPWIEFCHGRDPETRKMLVEKIPAKEIKIMPEQVLRYRGSVVADHNAVHTGNILMGHERIGYVFDRFFIHNGQRYDRCALVENKIHQAGLVYEKWVPKEKTRGFKPGVAYARLRRLAKSENLPMYEVFGYKETDYRDLKRLFERHFLKRGDVIQDEDPALRELFRAMPLVSTHS